MGTCIDCHGLAMLVPVQLDQSIQALFQSLPICSKPHNRENNMGSFAGLVVTADFEDLGGITSVDVVA